VIIHGTSKKALADNPLISTVLRETPGIVDILYEIREMEEYTPYLDRLDYFFM